MKRRVVFDAAAQRIRPAGVDADRLSWDVQTAHREKTVSAGRTEELSELVRREKTWSPRWWDLIRRLDEANSRRIYDERVWNWVRYQVRKMTSDRDILNLLDRLEA